ncbi:MAG: DNA-binding transcriptional regulator OxyR, partial [Pseudomonadales bacterium]|nr:DNA-binding transcriptional regulator OxyR [Pseudomonadales bacterium]
TATLPQLKLVLIEEKTQGLLDRLTRGELDAALLALPVHDDQLTVQPLFNDEFMLAVPPQHALVKHKQINQSEISGEKLLLLEEGHCLRDQALEVCHLAGLQEEQDFRATSLETLRQMVKAGTGITFMPKIAMQNNETGICYIPFKKPAPHRTIGLVWRKTSTRTSVIEKILTLLRQP